MPNLTAISQATTEINRGVESAPQALSVSNHPGRGRVDKTKQTYQQLMRILSFVSHFVLLNGSKFLKSADNLSQIWALFFVYLFSIYFEWAGQDF